MAKRKRKRAVKRRAAAKRTTVRRKKRRHVTAKRKKRTITVRATASNPRKRRRARRANPRAMMGARRRSSKRRHRRNPGIPSWAMAGVAGALGLGSYALATSAAFGLTKRFDPALAHLERNRYIAGGAMTLAGLLVAAFASPLLGAGVAAGGLAALAGTQLSFAIDPVFQLGAHPAPAPAPAPAAKLKGLGAVYGGGGQMLGMGAVFDGNRQNVGAVYDGQAQMLSGTYDSGDQFGG